MKNRIKAEMVRNGLRGSDLAGLLGISEQSLCAKLNGRRPFTADEILRIGSLLHVSCEYILKGGDLHGKTDS